MIASSSTMPTMLSTGGDNGFGGGGAWLAVILVALLGGRGGWGGNCGEGGAEVNGRFNEINASIDAAASREDLARNLMAA